MVGLHAQIDFREVELRQEQQILEQVVKSKYVDGYEVEALEIGDFVFDDLVCIERKTIPDFVSSMQEGDLEDQIYRMYQEYDHCYLLVSGNMVDFITMAHSKMNPDAILAFVASLTVRWQTPPIFCSTESLLAKEAIDIARKVYEPLERTPGKPAIQIHNDLGQVGKVAMTVDGIGEKTAKAIEKEVWTVGDLVRADAERLMTIPGIGQKTAAKVATTLQ